MFLWIPSISFTQNPVAFRYLNQCLHTEVKERLFRLPAQPHRLTTQWQAQPHANLSNCILAASGRRTSEGKEVKTLNV